MTVLKKIYERIVLFYRYFPKQIIAGVNIIIPILIVLICKPHYLVNDDNSMISIVCGAYGKPDAHMVYSNYLLGILLSTLYRIANCIPWYGLVYYLLMIWAFTELTMILREHSCSQLSRWFSLIILLCGYLEYYSVPTFTKTAALVGISGFVTVFNSLWRNNLQIKELIRGGVLCLFSFLIRSEMFLAVAPICGGLIFLVVYDYVNSHKKEEIRGRIKAAALFVTAFSICLLSCVTIDNYAYSSKEWTEYKTYNNLRSQLMDYGWPDYNDNLELYNSMDIDLDALRLYKSWNFDDPEILTVDKMEKLVEAKTDRIVDFRFIYTWFYTIVKTIIKDIPGFVCIIFMLVCIIRGKPDHSKLLTILFSVVSFTLIIFFLYYYSRCKSRVTCGLVYAFAVVFCITFSQTALTVPKIRHIWPLCISFFLIVYCYFDEGNISFSDVTYRERIDTQTLLEKINKQEDRFYLTDTGYPIMDSFYVFDSIPANCCNNIQPLGGWMTRCPLREAVFEQYSILNPFRALAENPNVYLIDNGQIDLITTYIQKHYYTDAVVEKIEQNNGASLYQFKIGS